MCSLVSRALPRQFMSRQFIRETECMVKIQRFFVHIPLWKINSFWHIVLIENVNKDCEKKNSLLRVRSASSVMNCCFLWQGFHYKTILSFHYNGFIYKYGFKNSDVSFFPVYVLKFQENFLLNSVRKTNEARIQSQMNKTNFSTDERKLNRVLK